MLVRVYCLRMEKIQSNQIGGDKFPKTYTFDVTKCDTIFDLLVKYGQMIVPTCAKVSPLEQRKKRGFCKYHNFIDHKTS